MQSDYPETFEREMGCTVDEWLGWLPAAIGDHPWVRDGDAVRVNLGAGTLTLEWRPLPPRQIALIRLPRLWVRFAFAGVDADMRRRFMRRFDLYMQRGGG
ncbi:hypothetical protein LCC91_02780 [Tepidimonas taiwanensis]|uniref:Polyketide cyclase / dehydrase and lipid transport n=1 Tax=Tepidimonas taiwanensis TaxID=307486 RepID=A0A554X8J4_9BURK|nr:hypothetical protein [Tepidimonas taiwanensis]MCX7693481.1 hypothetical protein [Tepidimonas taiwanensis]MDM7464189.1 hypothetical protein [Tepidimonas taiwanensis]TSE32149.1 hypothetical protein Ttaiw_01259 [Tepidimonas taiwanensis]UBQ06782.1 hypothetical protein LCC91_02780 [Tepidimonas taiwanensis]